MLNLWAPGRGHFWPQGYNFNNLGTGPPEAFWFLDKKIFKGFPYTSLCKTSGHQGRVIFGPRAIIWTVDKASYQILKTWAFWFQTGRLLKVFFSLFIAMATRVLHGMEFFEQLQKWTTQRSFLPSLVRIYSVVYGEMSFKVIVNRRQRLQTVTDHNRWAKNKELLYPTFSHNSKHETWLC